MRIGVCDDRKDARELVAQKIKNFVPECRIVEYASGEAAYISVRSYRKNNACMIEVRNSFTGQVKIEADTGLICSAKRQGLHGCGLANIRRTAVKYHGDIDITLKDGEFCLAVMLMME